MGSISPASLDSASKGKALTALTSTFNWSVAYRSFLQRAVEWQDAAEPRPNFYFRWHLPRIVTTLELLEGIAPSAGEADVLDLACFAPFSHLMESHLKSQGRTWNWTRTSYDGGTESFCCSGDAINIETIGVDLNANVLPFKSRTFDAVLFAETIEHVHTHPQHILYEINRILKPGGVVLITTPNVTSWKKIKALSDGNWDYDSPTFGSMWGHRFEFSPYQVQQMLRATGFEAVKEIYRNVYFDDPRGLSMTLQMCSLGGAKILSGDWKRAYKMFSRRGSGMFMLYRKQLDATPVTSESFVVI